MHNTLGEFLFGINQFYGCVYTIDKYYISDIIINILAFVHVAEWGNLSGKWSAEGL